MCEEYKIHLRLTIGIDSYPDTCTLYIIINIIIINNNNNNIILTLNTIAPCGRSSM